MIKQEFKMVILDLTGQDHGDGMVMWPLPSVGEMKLL